MVARGRKYDDLLKKENLLSDADKKKFLSSSPRSPDLTPMDYFLWGFVKNHIYQTRAILSQEETMLKVNEAFAILSNNPRMVQDATADIIRRVNFVIRATGQHIEPYPRNFDFERQRDNLIV